jgi:hypothetical protein
MRRAVFAGVLVLLAVEGAMAVARARSNVGFFSQPGAFSYLLYLLLVLVIYMAFTLWLGAKSESQLLPFPRLVLIAGAAAGLLEIFGIIVENLLPALTFLPITIEISIFLSWAGIAALASRRGHSVRGGIFTAIIAAALCMVIAVCGGEIAEFFVHPPTAAEVSRWAEFQRSHWSDAASFQIANTIDSATVHLTVAPLVALILGSAGAAAGLARAK